MKKYLLLLIALISLSRSSFAECGGGGLYVWPLTETLKQDAFIILEGYADSQDYIRRLSWDSSAFLISGDHKVRLKVIGMYEGHFAVTQALLKPVEKLHEGKEYTLDTGEERSGGWDPKTGKYKASSWKIEGATDTQPPVWKREPKYESREYTSFGCGPARYVHFDHKIEDDSPVIIFTTVKEIKTGKVSQYYIIVNNSRLSLGHGMCSGAFSFGEGEEYEATFEAVDNCGNRKAISKAYKFTGPTGKDERH